MLKKYNLTYHSRPHWKRHYFSSPFYRWGNWYPKGLSSTENVTWLLLQHAWTLSHMHICMCQEENYPAGMVVGLTMKRILVLPAPFLLLQPLRMVSVANLSVKLEFCAGKNGWNKWRERIREIWVRVIGGAWGALRKGVWELPSCMSKENKR